MPLVVLGVLLLPLGLGWLAFMPMQYGVDALLSLAHYVASLPYAMLLVPAPTDAGFFVVVLGLVWLYFWRGRIRLLGLPFIAAGLCTALAYVPPDMLISGDGKHIALRVGDGSAFMLKGRNDSFIAGQWEHAMLVQNMGNKKESPANCDKQGCIIRQSGHVIALPKTQEAALDDCASADIIIATGFAIAPETCHAVLLIDQNTLNANGATAVRFSDGKLLTEFTNTIQGSRPWQSAAEGED
jgi:competence protein ComEC